MFSENGDCAADLKDCDKDAMMIMERENAAAHGDGMDHAGDRDNGTQDTLHEFAWGAGGWRGTRERVIPIRVRQSIPWGPSRPPNDGHPFLPPKEATMLLTK